MYIYKVHIFQSTKQPNWGDGLYSASVPRYSAADGHDGYTDDGSQLSQNYNTVSFLLIRLYRPSGFIAYLGAPRDFGSQAHCWK